MKRAEFNAKTKHTVAGRAGYRCSFPACDKPTIGPANLSGESHITGIAAHIYGAALSGDGPRGTSQLSKQELKSAQNAIWLCAHHANLIDKKRGEDYSADTLHSYKLLHETRIAHEMAGIHTPFGWVRNFTVHSSPLFKGSFEIEFAKLNLIVGGNSVGKTAVCEWIAGTSNPKYMERWGTVYPRNLNRLSTSLEFFFPNRSLIEVDFIGNNYPRYKLNGERTLIAPRVVKVMFPKSLELPTQGAHDDRRTIVNSMGLHPYELQGIFDKLPDTSAYFKGAYFEKIDENASMFVKVQAAEKVALRLLRMLSSTEQERLILELGSIAANKLSMIGPTLLILDTNSWEITTDWLAFYAERFSSRECRFQTVVSTRSQDINFAEVSWTGWKVFQLEGTPPNAVVFAGT